LRAPVVSSIVRPSTRTPMKMQHANNETLSSAAAYAATGASCRQKPFGSLRPDDDQALAGGCAR